MKQPLAAVAALFSLGILIGRFIEPPPEALFLGTFALGLAPLARPSHRFAPHAFAAFLVLAGWTHLSWQHTPLHPHDLRHLGLDPEQLATLDATLLEPPRTRIHTLDGRSFTNTVARLECHRITRNRSSPSPAWGRIVASTPAALPASFRRGDRVRVEGILRVPPGPRAPGLFDYAQHLRWQGVHYELRAPTPNDWISLAPSTAPPAWTERFENWARQTLALGLNPGEVEVGLLWAMTVGWKAGVTDEVEEAFMRSGTLHVFAISGLHVGLLAAILTQALRVLHLPRMIIGLLVLPAIGFYTIATGAQPSAIRASVMASVVVGSWMIARPTHLLNSLATAAFLLLLWDPRELFQPGFQLSFTVVAAIAWLHPLLVACLGSAAQPDPFLPDSLRPAWQIALRHLWHRIANALAVTLSAWLGSLPLTAAFFHLVTPVSLLANLAVVPLSSVTLLACLCSLACGAWAPALSELFNHSAWLGMNLMRQLSAAAAAVPGGSWHVASPPGPAIALAFLILATLGHRGWRLRPLRLPLALTALTLALWSGLEWHRRATVPRLVVLPLGGGHAVWWNRPSSSLLVDPGDRRSATSVTRPFLHAQGLDRIGTLLLSHGDVRHVGGAPQIAADFQPDSILISPLKFRSTAYRDALRQLHQPPLLAPTPTALPDSHPGFRVLHPAPDDRFSRADDGSLVLLLDLPGLPDSPVLLAADLGRLGQERLWQRHPDLRADLVIAGTTDQGDSIHPDLLRHWGASLVIIADASQPATARASPAYRQRLRVAGIPAWFTSDTGALDLRWPGKAPEIRDARGRRLTR